MQFSEAVDIEKREKPHDSRCHYEPAVGRTRGRPSGSAGEESLLKFWCQLVAAPFLQLVILSEVAAIFRRPLFARKSWASGAFARLQSVAARPRSRRISLRFRMNVAASSQMQQ